MNAIDNLARRFQISGDHSLADYFLAQLPCQLLLIDALVIERRPLPTPTEFILKAVKAGLSNAEEISGLLGLSARYTKKLLTELKADQFIAGDELGRLMLLRRAHEALAADGERLPIDRTISLLWDPVIEAPIQSRPELLTQKTAERSGQIWRLPNAFSPPSLESLTKANFESYLKAVHDANNGREAHEILRLVALRKTFFWFRPVLVLVYEKDGSAPIFKVVVNGQIDDVLSSGIAQRDGAKYIGLDGSFGRKAGAIAVKERHRLVPVTPSSESTAKIDLAALSRQKSSVKLGLEILRERYQEEQSESLASKINEREAELSELDRMLGTIEIVPLSPFDVPLIVEEVLSDAVLEITFTSTTPSTDRFSASVVKQLEQALTKGVKVSIYLTGRPQGEDGVKSQSRSNLATMNEMTKRFKNLHVHFLRNLQRPVFEIAWDRTSLIFTNDPPLGDRPIPFTPRCFRGYRLSGGSQVTYYSEKYLTFQDDDLVQRIRPPSQKSVKGREDKHGSQRGPRK